MGPRTRRAPHNFEAYKPRSTRKTKYLACRSLRARQKVWHLGQVMPKYLALRVHQIFWKIDHVVQTKIFAGKAIRARDAGQIFMQIKHN